MDTKMLCLMLNFIGKFEKELHESLIEKPLALYRFIDDGDMNWAHDEEELNTFITRANNQHLSIKFTRETSTTNISFLDNSVHYQRVSCHRPVLKTN